MMHLIQLHVWKVSSVDEGMRLFVIRCGLFWHLVLVFLYEVTTPMEFQSGPTCLSN